MLLHDGSTGKATDKNMFVPHCYPVWPDWATLDSFLKPLAAIKLPKSSPLLGNFCKGVKINNFTSEIILGNFYRHLAIFFWSHCCYPNHPRLLEQSRFKPCLKVCGQSYKASMLVNYDSKIVIYDRKMFIRLGTGRAVTSCCSRQTV